MTLPYLPLLAAFMALVLVAAMFLLTAAGHFPATDRMARMRAGLGLAILWASIPATAVAIALALPVVWAGLPLYAIVIGGGLMLLFAPLALQLFPDSFVDGRRGLVSLCAATLVLAALVWWLSA